MTGDPGGVVRHRGPVFWVATAAGWALAAWGVRGIVVHRIDTRPAQLLRFFVTGLVLHDGLFAPAVLLGGIVLARTVPARWRATLQAALLVAGTAALYAYPLVRDYAHILRNPTSLPRNYSAGLALFVAAVALAAVAVRLLARLGRKGGPGVRKRSPV